MENTETLEAAEPAEIPQDMPEENAQAKLKPEKVPKGKAPEADREKPVPRTIRLTDKTKAQLDAVLKQIGGSNQDAAMQSLISIYELDAARNAVPGSADVIDEVQSHVESIVHAFLLQLDRNLNTDARIRQEYAGRIEGLETALQDYQKRAQEARETALQAQQALDSCKAQADEESRLAAAAAALLTDRAERAEQSRQETEAARQVAQQTADELALSVKDLRAERDRLQAIAGQAEELRRQLAEALEENRKQKSAAALAAQQAELARAQAVLETERLFSAKSEELREKIETLRDEKAALQDRLREITAERDDLLKQVKSLKAASSTKSIQTV